MDSPNAPSPHPPATAAVEVDDLVDKLPSCSTEVLRAAVTAVATDDLAQLIEDLDPRQRSGEVVRQRTVTRRARADVADACGEPGDVDAAPTDPVASQLSPSSVSGAQVSDPEGCGSAQGGQQ